MRQKQLPLSDRHRQVVDNYFTNGLKKVQALRDAGYSEYSAHQVDHVFKRRDVIEEIERRQAKMSEKAQVTAEWIIQKYKDIVDANLGDLLVIQDDGTAYIDLNKATAAHLANLMDYSVEEIKEGRGKGKRELRRMRVRMQDKLKALEALGRHLGMFNDKITVQGNIDLVGRIQQGRERARIKDITEEVISEEL